MLILFELLESLPIWYHQLLAKDISARRSKTHEFILTSLTNDLWVNILTDLMITSIGLDCVFSFLNTLCMLFGV